MNEQAGFEDNIDLENYDGTEDWDRMRDQTVIWEGHGSRIQSIALLQDRNALLEYQGSDEEKVMQWISDNLDLNCPNQYMINDLADIIDMWALKRIKATEAKEQILTTLQSYIGGC